MSESKHTAGPWRIEGRRGPGYIISHGVCAEGDGPEGYVGVLDPMFHVAGAPTALEANARLIAACPTMHDYIVARARAGDAEAAQIVEAIHASR